jgi:hypothetical protein
MGAKDVLTRKTGVIVGDDVLNLFKYAKEKQFAIPAIVSWPLPSFRFPGLTAAECHFFINRCSRTRGCT